MGLHAINQRPGLKRLHPASLIYYFQTKESRNAILFMEIRQPLYCKKCPLVTDTLKESRSIDN